MDERIYLDNNEVNKIVYFVGFTRIKTCQQLPIGMLVLYFEISLLQIGELS